MAPTLAKCLAFSFSLGLLLQAGCVCGPGPNVGGYDEPGAKDPPRSLQGIKFVESEKGDPTPSADDKGVARHDHTAGHSRAARVHQALESATVVGPERDEVFTDDLGRVRVRFHWDLGKTQHGGDSTWIRVSQSWAGAGYGTQFVPRVGMEVIVSFLGGDPDRPVDRPDKAEAPSERGRAPAYRQQWRAPRL